MEKVTGSSPVLPTIFWTLDELRTIEVFLMEGTMKRCMNRHKKAFLVVFSIFIIVTDVGYLLAAEVSTKTEGSKTYLGRPVVKCPYCNSIRTIPR